MLFFYVRHGHPIYNPDSLTPLGEEQAKAVAKRLAMFGIDKVYSSTSNRAILTSKPTCDLLGLQPELLDFANEARAWEGFAVPKSDGSGKSWAFSDKETKMLFNTKEIKDLGSRWYEHPDLKRQDFGESVDKLYKNTDEFFASLGYEHDRESGRYKIVRPNKDRVAMFAHQGFGLAFLSCVLDIPYPVFSTHFDINHSGMTVIDFVEVDGYAIPKVLGFSLDSHLYKEGLPMRYNNGTLAF